MLYIKRLSPEGPSVASAIGSPSATVVNARCTATGGPITRKGKTFVEMIRMLKIDIE